MLALVQCENIKENTLAEILKSWVSLTKLPVMNPIFVIVTKLFSAAAVRLFRI